MELILSSTGERIPGISSLYRDAVVDPARVKAFNNLLEESGLLEAIKKMLVLESEGKIRATGDQINSLIYQPYLALRLDFLRGEAVTADELGEITARVHAVIDNKLPDAVTANSPACPQLEAA